MGMERRRGKEEALSLDQGSAGQEAKASAGQTLQNLLNQGGLSLHKAHQPSLNKAVSGAMKKNQSLNKAQVSQLVQKKRQFQNAKSPSPTQKMHQSLQRLSRQWSLSQNEQPAQGQNEQPKKGDDAAHDGADDKGTLDF